MVFRRNGNRATSCEGATFPKSFYFKTKAPNSSNVLVPVHSYRGLARVADIPLPKLTKNSTATLLRVPNCKKLEKL